MSIDNIMVQIMKASPRQYSSLTLVLLISLTGCILTGCGAPSKYRIDSATLDKADTGIVFGRVTNQRFFGLLMYNGSVEGRGIGFKNQETGEEFTYTFARYFEMKLPKGLYQITALGSPAGGLIPKEKPFLFSVEPGTIKYIGSIVGDRDIIRHLEEKGVRPDKAFTVIFSSKEYGLARPKAFLSSEMVADEPFIRFFIIDENNTAKEEFLKKYPQFKNDKIAIDFMN